MSKRYFIFGGFIAVIVAVCLVFFAGKSFGTRRGGKMIETTKLNNTIAANEDFTIVATSLKKVDTDAFKDAADANNIELYQYVLNYRVLRNGKDNTNYKVVFRSLEINGKETECENSVISGEAGQVYIKCNNKIKKLSDMTVEVDVFDAVKNVLLLRSDSVTINLKEKK